MGHDCIRASMMRWQSPPALLPLLSQLFHDVLLACACALAAAAQPLNVAVELPTLRFFAAHGSTPSMDYSPFPQN
jgi:hypothetical protein